MNKCICILLVKLHKIFSLSFAVFFASPFFCRLQSLSNVQSSATLCFSLPLHTAQTPTSFSRRRPSPIVVGLIFSTPFPGVTPFKGKSRRRTNPTPPRACSPTTLFTSLFLVSHFLFPEIPNSRCYSISLHLFSFTWFQILPAVAEVEPCVSLSRVSGKGVTTETTHL